MIRLDVRMTLFLVRTAGWVTAPSTAGPTGKFPERTHV